MKDIFRVSQLFDFYGSLLTSKQRQYIQEYYFNDLSLNEIGNKYLISKNAIFDSIKKSIIDLEEYDKKLNLISGYNKRIDIYKKYNLNQKIIDELWLTEVIANGK